MLRFKFVLLLRLNQHLLNSVFLLFFFKRNGTNPEASEVPDPSSLTDRDLKAELLKHGVTAGPIVGQCELNTQFYVSPGVNSRVAVIFCFFLVGI